MARSESGAFSEAGAAPASPSEPQSFWEWVNLLPRQLLLFAAGAGALVSALPPSMLPEPLHAPRTLGIFVVGLVLPLAWRQRAWLRPRLRGIGSAALGLLITLILLNQLYVKPVVYRSVEDGVARADTVWFITGSAVVDPALAGMTAEDLIRHAGGGWDEFRVLWGSSFVWVALTYTLLYLLVIAGFILCAGGLEPVRREPGTRLNAAAVPAGAGSRKRGANRAGR